MASRAQNKVIRSLNKRENHNWVVRSQNISSAESTSDRKKNIRLSSFTIAHRNLELVPVKRWHKLKIARLKKLQNEDFMCSWSEVFLSCRIQQFWCLGANRQTIFWFPFLDIVPQGGGSMKSNKKDIHVSSPFWEVKEREPPSPVIPQ